MERENYYLLLELPFDPPEKDQVRIDEAIKNKQFQWSRERVHPTKGIKAQKNLSIIHDIKKIMADPEARIQEALSAQKIKYESLDKAIKTISVKGYVYSKELENLSKMMGVPIEIIRKRITVKENKDTSTKENIEEQGMDKSTINKIESLLNVINKPNLYEFMGIDRTSTNIQLSKKADEIYSSFRKKMASAENVAITELAGLCKRIFSSDRERKKYDLLLRENIMADVNEKINIASLTGQIHRDVVVEILKDIVEKGYTKEKAVEYLKVYCMKKKIFVDLPSNQEDRTGLNFQQCGVCGLVNDISNDKKMCTKCGNHLNVSCPRCKTQNPSSADACKNCGFSSSNIPRIKALCEKLSSALNEMDFDIADGCVAQADEYWPDNRELVVLKEMLQTKKRVFNDHKEKVKNFISMAFYYTANDELEALKKKMPKYSDTKVEQEISLKIKSTEEWIKKADNATNESDIVEFAIRALEESKDNPNALNLVNKYPPEPPSELKVVYKESSNLIHWQPSKSKGRVFYKVLCKKHSIPKNDKEVDYIKEVSGTSLNDDTIESGIPYYYSVYAVRGGVSSTPLTCREAIINYKEVNDLKLSTGERCINVKWNRPLNSKGFEVWRKEGAAPNGRKDGVKINFVTNEGFLDTGLKGETKYNYLILTKYEYNGKIVYSKGAAISAIADKMPEPITDFHVYSVGENTFEAKWKELNKGEVILYFSNNPVIYKVGENLEKSEIDKTMNVLPLIEANSGKVRFNVNSGSIYYVVPIIVFSDVYIIGTSKRVSYVDDFENVNIKYLYKKLYVEFDWPENSNEAIILYRSDKEPINMYDEVAAKKTITKSKYMVDAAVVIENLENRNYYFKIYAAYVDGLTKMFSLGKKIVFNNEPVKEIKYDVKINRNIVGKIKDINIIISCDSDTIYIPDIQIVAKKRGIPLNKTDGEIIHTISECSIEKKRLSVSMPAYVVEEKSYIKLFFSDERYNKSFRFIAPTISNLYIKG